MTVMNTVPEEWPEMKVKVCRKGSASHGKGWADVDCVRMVKNMAEKVDFLG
jgi:hypothetical protein